MKRVTEDKKWCLLMKHKYKITYNSPVVLSFVTACFVVMIINYITGGVSNKIAFMTYHSSLVSPMTYVRLFTHVLGHANWEHFIGNMAYILLLGPMLEEKYGSLRVVHIIAVTAAVIGVINYVFFWDVALCGASGICFAFILLSSFISLREGEIPLTVILVAVIFLGQQIHEGIVVQDNISNIAHVIGGIIGGIIGFSLNKK
ncbi:intramembrane serine protease GlpG [Blautia glucerasea]|uniref:Intramembrane serine protease GlpG n=2 Tax=Lachnospiraceae TaxID=186803 RepID=A0A6N2SQJ5_9FIRM